MNTNLLLSLSHIKQASEYIQKASKELYIEDLFAENEQAKQDLEKATESIYTALAGALGDAEADSIGANHKPNVTNNVVYIGVHKND